MISVVIPAYNAKQLMSNCLAGLESQTKKDFEVIFVDDCSTDGTYDMLMSYKEGSSLSVTLLRNEQNRGPAFSRNRGILMARSKYITFCDCDDWFDPSFIEIMSGLLETTGADLAFCGYKIICDNRVELRPIAKHAGRVKYHDAFSLNVDSLCMMMVKASLMKDTLLPDLRNGEDVATVSLLLAKSNAVAVTDKCLYNYFRRTGSASESPTMRVVDSLIASFEYTKNKFPSGMKEELEYLGIKNMLYPTIITLFSIGYNTDKAKEIIRVFEGSFPIWTQNKYLSNLDRYKRIVLFFTHHRLFFVVRAIAFLRRMLIK